MRVAIEYFLIGRSQDHKHGVEHADTQSPMSLLKRSYTTAITPLQRGRAYLTDRMRGSRFAGWRTGSLCGCIMTCAVLCLNIALLLFGAISNGGYRGGVVDIVYGDDRAVARWNTGLHVLINILGSCLLAANNYTIQVMSSPTREEIDKVHADGSWLAVGLLSPAQLEEDRKETCASCIGTRPIVCTSPPIVSADLQSITSNWKLTYPQLQRYSL